MSEEKSLIDWRKEVKAAGFTGEVNKLNKEQCKAAIAELKSPSTPNEEGTTQGDIAADTARAELQERALKLGLVDTESMPEDELLTVVEEIEKDRAEKQAMKTKQESEAKAISDQEDKAKAEADLKDKRIAAEQSKAKADQEARELADAEAKKADTDKGDARKELADEEQKLWTELRVNEKRNAEIKVRLQAVNLKQEELKVEIPYIEQLRMSRKLDQQSKKEGMGKLLEQIAKLSK